MPRRKPTIPAPLAALAPLAVLGPITLALTTQSLVESESATAPTHRLRPAGRRG